MSNFHNLLLGRSLRDNHSQEHYHRQLENVLEDSLLVNHHYDVEELPLDANVSSTISIAMSKDGQYYASTHGDHTVKVFHYQNQHHQQVRCFRGHPRTPWSVKFNPINSNILASGCLGFQVRIWSIEQNGCLGLLRLEAPIISLSFHPNGNHIAIASGSRLEIWNYMKNITDNSRSTASRRIFDESVSAGGSSSSSFDFASSQTYLSRSVAHTRNMRATIFHPSGEYLLVAAPDTRRQQNSSLTFCNLFAIKFSTLLRTGETSGPNVSPPPPLELSTFPTILAQVHLYSDGGIDISNDGKFLLICGRLKYQPTVSFLNSKRRNSHTKHKTSHLSVSPMSTTDRQVINGDVDNNTTLQPPPLQHPSSNSNSSSSSGNSGGIRLNNRDIAIPGISFSSLFSLNNRSNTSTNTSSSTSNSAAISSDPTMGLFDFLGTGNMVGGNINNAKISLSDRDRATLERTIERAPGIATNTNGGVLGGTVFGSVMNGNQSQLQSSNNNATTIPLSPPFLRTAQQEEQHQESRVVASESSSSSSSEVSEEDGGGGNSSSNGSRKHALSHSYLAKYMDGDDEMEENYRLAQTTFAFRSIDLCQKQWASTQRPPDYSSSNRIPSVNCNQMVPFPLNVDVNDPAHAITTNPDSFVCLYQLKFDPTSGEILQPTLHSCKKLQSQLLQAITSARMSSTCRYIMLGFGVRRDGLVVGHREPKAVCEIMSLISEDLDSVCTITDDEDEVNIAQFHPSPGVGVVYGTKRGKVRILARSY